MSFLSSDLLSLNFKNTKSRNKKVPASLLNVEALYSWLRPNQTSCLCFPKTRASMPSAPKGAKIFGKARVRQSYKKTLN